MNDTGCGLSRRVWIILSRFRPASLAMLCCKSDTGSTDCERRRLQTMQRVAFLLRLKPGAGPAYDRAHQQVWPEMLALLKRSGISDYSIFRRDELLLLVM